MSLSTARLAAYKSLIRIEKDAAFSSEVLAKTLQSMSYEDAKLATAIVLGVLRLRPCIDAFLQERSKKPIKKLDLEVLVSLRMGIFQTFELGGVPSHAAVNDSVNLVKKHGKGSASGFVNAILRKTVRSQKDGLELSREELKSGTLYNRWVDRYGSELADEFVLSNSSPPNTAFRFTAKYERLSDQEKEPIMTTLGSFSASGTVDGCYFLRNSGNGLRRLAENGFVYNQDQSSQFVGQFVKKLSGSSFWDVCAAPGGKSMIASSGFESIVATEFSVKRAALMKRLSELQGVNLNIIASDGLKPSFSRDEGFDVVLVDAPCSGTGTIRKNPEIRYRFSEDSLAAFKKKQLSLLESASKHVNQGGFLIFSTCSLEKEEGEDVKEEFLRRSRDFSPSNGYEESVLVDGSHRILPGSDGGEGFFVACFHKVS